MYAKVSKKGQITIPKAIRQEMKLGEESAVLFLVENGEVKLKAVPAGIAEHLAGSLKKYANKYVPLNEIRDKIQRDIGREIDEDEH